VSFGLDLRKYFFDPAVGADEERRALDAHVGASVHAFLFPHAIGFGDRVVGIGDECVAEPVLGGELLLRLAFIGRDAGDFGIGLGKLPGCVAKLARLFRSTGRVGLGEEEEHDALAFEFRKLEAVRLDFRRAVARFESHTPEIVN